jgi:hypothetical protein
MMVHKQHKTKWIPTDAWRGYEQSVYAVLGSSDTGKWSDSPCPSDEVNKELKKFQSFLKSKGIDSELKTTKSSNVFMKKRWVVVSPKNHKRALKIANDYLKKDKESQYIHGVD